jgi:HAMP domain-containing protein
MSATDIGFAIAVAVACVLFLLWRTERQRTHVLRAVVMHLANDAAEAVVRRNVLREEVARLEAAVQRWTQQWEAADRERLRLQVYVEGRQMPADREVGERLQHILRRNATPVASGG